MRRLPRRVLAIGAHPDDVELLCAGTLARFSAEGSDVAIGVVCLGDRGGGDGSDPSLAAVRREESERSASILGAEFRSLGASDSEAGETPGLKLKMICLLRDFRPDLVITHGPNDYHDDHARVSDLVTKCSWYSASSGHVPELAPLDRPPALIYMDNVAGMGFEPTHYVDITAVIEVKRRMLACHAGQMRRTDAGFPSLETLAETLARLRGFQCGVTFAEGFRLALLWGRTRPEPILP